MVLLSSQELWAGISVALIIFFATKKRLKALRPLFALVTAVAFTDAIAFQVLKPYFARPRPCFALENINLVQDRCGGDFGFPSNHAANGGATLAFISHFQRRNLLILSFILVALVCLSRVYLGVHYPLDVMGGALFGFILSSNILKFFLNRKRPVLKAAL